MHETVLESGCESASRKQNEYENEEIFVFKIKHAEV